MNRPEFLLSQATRAAHEYRPDIDGLRAIAVMAVILFHAGFTSLGGGFVGVDVFFVISGYLITKKLTEEMATDRFSFSGFYVGRFRRLFPAFFVVTAATFLFGMAILSPTDMSDLSESTIYAVLYLSNWYFWSNLGYFDTDAGTKPLLHMWSLAVEEQFYLVWPAALAALALMRRRWLAPVVIAVASLASLIAAEYFLSETTFFMPHLRVFEFGLGALLVWIRYRPSQLLQEILLVAGLCLIAYATIEFTEATLFPSAYTLVPCIGAALVIYAGGARYSGMILRNPVSVWIGKVSYSAYLVHWPIAVYFYLLTYRSPTIAESWALVAAAVALAFPLYFFVEQPFRNARARGALSNPAFAVVCLSMTITLMFPASTAFGSGGWMWRVPESRVLPDATTELRRIRSFCGAKNPSVPAKLFSCQVYADRDRDLFLFGDSHGDHLFAGLQHFFKGAYNIHVAFHVGCLPQTGVTLSPKSGGSCADHNRSVMKALEGHRPSVVVLAHAFRKREGLAEATNELIARLERAGHTVVYIGDIIRPGKFLSNCVSVPEILISDASNNLRCVGDPQWPADHLHYDRQMKDAIPGYISLAEKQCRRGKCLYFLEGQPLFRDDHHLTFKGSHYLIAQIRGEIRDRIARDVAARN